MIWAIAGLLSSGEVYQLRPDFVMPYMIGETDEVEKALYLRRYGVPLRRTQGFCLSRQLAP